MACSLTEGPRESCLPASFSGGVVPMASHTFCSGPLPGTQLRTVQTGERRRRLKSILTVAGVSNKVTTYDDKWSKGFFGSGYFVEDKETDAPNYLRTLERKKVLSNIEQLGLLSAAEKAGLSLSKLEELKLFSTAERLGLLSTLERLLVADPAAVSSLSLVPFVGTIATLSLLPSDPAPLAIAKYAVAAVLAGSTVMLFGLGLLIAAIQEE